MEIEPTPQDAHEGLLHAPAYQPDVKPSASAPHPKDRVPDGIPTLRAAEGGTVPDVATNDAPPTLGRGRGRPRRFQPTPTASPPPEHTAPLEDAPLAFPTTSQALIADAIPTLQQGNRMLPRSRRRWILTIAASLLIISLITSTFIIGNHLQAIYAQQTAAAGTAQEIATATQHTANLETLVTQVLATEAAAHTQTSTAMAYADTQPYTAPVPGLCDKSGKWSSTTALSPSLAQCLPDRLRLDAPAKGDLNLLTFTRSFLQQSYPKYRVALTIVTVAHAQLYMDIDFSTQPTAYVFNIGPAEPQNQIASRWILGYNNGPESRDLASSGMSFHNNMRIEMTVTSPSVNNGKTHIEMMVDNTPVLNADDQHLAAGSYATGSLRIGTFSSLPPYPPFPPEYLEIKDFVFTPLP